MGDGGCLILFECCCCLVVCFGLAFGFSIDVWTKDYLFMLCCINCSRVTVRFVRYIYDNSSCEDWGWLRTNRWYLYTVNQTFCCSVSIQLMQMKFNVMFYDTVALLSTWHLPCDNCLALSWFWLQEKQEVNDACLLPILSFLRLCVLCQS